MGAPDVTSHDACSGAARSRADALSCLRGVSAALGSHLGVDLPVPLEDNPQDIASQLKRDKEFSSALLEGRPHPWGTAIRRLPATTKMTIAGSLFLWRKSLPVVEPPTPESHRACVTAPEIDLPKGYLPHVYRECLKIFPVGWDSGYCGFVHGDTPTMKSVTENKRSDGGWRGMGPDRESHARKCYEGVDPYTVDRKVRFSVAPCDGKLRAVTVMSSTAQILKPLHRLLYDHISKAEWCLRGEANAKRFSSFVRVPGEVFVSGDYESATDHLPVTTAECILRAAKANSRLIPESIWQVAFDYLRVEIVYPDGVTSRATRQLMGSLLCFPLLCLQNYLAFRWVFSAEVPVRINGDDIIFRATREQYERWARFVASVGLRLSPGKTMVHRTFFSLNSTFFRASEKYVRLVPVVRFSSLIASKCVYPNSLKGALRGFLLGFRGELRDRLAALWLRARAKLIRKSGRSVTRGLGIAVSDRALKSAGLWHRELWYFNTAPVDRHGHELKLPQPPTMMEGRVKIPPGWKRVSAREARGRTEEQNDFFDDLLELAWAPCHKSLEDLTNDYFNLVSSTGFESHWQRWSKKDKTRNVRRRLFGSLLEKPRLPSRSFYKFRMSSYRKEFWVRDLDFEGLIGFRALPFDCSEVVKKKPIVFRYGGLVSDFSFSPTKLTDRKTVPFVFRDMSAPLSGPSVATHLAYLRSRLSFESEGESTAFLEAAARAGISVSSDTVEPRLFPPTQELSESSSFSRWYDLEERACRYIQ